MAAQQVQSFYFGYDFEIITIYVAFLILKNKDVTPSKGIKINTCKSVILLFMYGCETWSLTLREERRLRVCEGGYG